MKLYHSFIFRLIFSVVVAMIIVIGGVATNFFIKGIKEEYSQAYIENQQILDSIKITIQNELDQSELSLKILSLNQNFIKKEFEEIDFIAKNIVNDTELIDQIYYMNEIGEQIYKTSHIETLGDRSYRDYFKEAIKGKTYLSNGLVSNSTERAITVLAVPVYDKGNIIGVLGATLNLSSIYEYIGNIRLGKDGYAFLVDREGTLIAHPDINKVENFENVSYLEPVKNMIDKKDGIGKYKYEDVNKLVVYEYLEHIGWGLAVQIPETEALIRIKKLRNEFIGYTILVFVITIIVTLVLTEIYSRYFNEFVEKIRNLRNKNYEKPFNKIRTDEIGTIQRAINDMAHETKEAKENLELIVERRTRKLKQSLEFIKEKENELEEKNKKLEKTLNELKRTENKLIENKKIQSLNRLSNSLAHEINTPLGIILTNISYGELETKDINKKLLESKISKSELLKYLDKMMQVTKMEQQQAQKLRELLNAFKAIAINGADLEKLETDIGKEIQTAIYLYQSQHENEKMNIDMKLQKNVNVKTYPSMIGSIIQQFLKNSYIHGREDNENININIEMKHVKNKTIIEYKDDGTGIETDQALQIFEPFYKGRMSSEGIGLGLSLVHNIVSVLLEGTIEIQTEKNKGVAIKIEFEN